MHDGWVIHAVARTGHKPQLHLWPGLSELHGCRRRAHQVPLPLHGNAGYVPHPVYVIQQRLLVQERSMHAEMCLQECLGVAVFVEPPVLQTALNKLYDTCMLLLLLHSSLGAVC